MDFSDELDQLLNALCERRLTSAQAARLEQLVLSSPNARWRYVTYLDLHGTLYWDAVGGLAAAQQSGAYETLPAASIIPAVNSRAWRRQHVAISASLAALLLVGILWWKTAPTGHVTPTEVVVQPAETPSPAISDHPAPTIAGPRQPVRLGSQDSTLPIATITDPPEVTTPSNTPPVETQASLVLDAALPTDVQRPVAVINHRIRASWTAANVSPSARAEDAAWLRRVFLDLTGRIPTVAEVRGFLDDRRADKRTLLVDRLLDEPEYVRNLTTQWANLLVGRVAGAQVDRPALQKFLRTSFAQNRGWDAIVTDLVAAEGRADENGAANFLIAHLNNQAVPATAITARLFLGVQVQCTQCHHHPAGAGLQTDFWELNSFFHQTQAVTLQQRDAITGQVKSTVAELVSQPTGGPTFYEMPNGVMKAVYPRYHGQDISPDPSVNRRQELARLMTEDDGAQLAAAFVNRTWQHFFGYGFTRPVDDMGPHNPASHPELLAELATEFRQSGYDIKQLTRWICLSEPYQLSSRFDETNQLDNPERGEVALFSRVYPRPMTVEQLYDSFLVATKAHQAHAADWTQAEAQRQAWLQQFIVSFQTEENDEANTFDGTVTQALTLMNGPLIDKALEPSAGTYLAEVLRKPGNDTEKIEQLCLAALSRKPSPRELTAMHKLVRKSPGNVEGYQDLFWALLNSNEFSVTY